MQRGWIGGELLRHEAECDEGPDTVSKQPIVDLIDIRKVIDRGVARGLRCKAGILDAAIGVVETDIVHQNAVETNGLKVSGLLDGPQVIAIALAQREDGAAGAERLFPEVGEGRAGIVGVNRHHNMRRLRRKEWCEEQKSNSCDKNAA